MAGRSERRRCSVPFPHDLLLSSAHLWNTLLDDVDFNYYRNDILEILEGFDRRRVSIIQFDPLVALIDERATRTGQQQQHVRDKLEQLFPMVRTMQWTRLEFIALLPAMIYIESCPEHGRALFRFRDHSMLDSHMQRPH